MTMLLVGLGLGLDHQAWLIILINDKTNTTYIDDYQSYLQADILELADRIIPEQCVLECFIDPFTGALIF